MIEALMYGITPIEKMEKRPSAPPENVFRKPSRFRDWALKMALMASALTPGIGMDAPTRKIGQRAERKADPPPQVRDFEEVADSGHLKP